MNEEKMNMDIDKVSAVYFVGAGGIGMSALIRYFLSKGIKVGGYDRTSSELTEQLIKEGADIHYEDNIDLIPADFTDRTTTLIVYTAAIPDTNSELSFFRNLDFEMMKRARVLGEITNRLKSLCVAGTHAFILWHEPHPIYFAEMDYRLHPTPETLDKWRDIVIQTADYMASNPFYDKHTKKYVIGPPIVVVSENTDPMQTINPVFELSYWRYGLRTALKWADRLQLPTKATKRWREVLQNLAPLPVKDGVYTTYEGIPDMWTKFTFEHPALTGILGMLPGDGVDKVTFDRTLDKVSKEWQFDRIWGWDFPMMAMAAARTGRPTLAVDMLMHPSYGFQFDEHGLATGGPFPYFPSNGALLTAVAMMCGGWDGSVGEVPGFPKDGSWTVHCEGFVPMQ